MCVSLAGAENVIIFVDIYDTALEIRNRERDVFWPGWSGNFCRNWLEYGTSIASSGKQNDF